MSYYTAPLSAYALADNSKQAARATPKGSLSMLCAGEAKNAKQPRLSVEPKFSHFYNHRPGYKKKSATQNL
jgi:hypothetical protein